jgi:hypothetical protein
VPRTVFAGDAGSDRDSAPTVADSAASSRKGGPTRAHEPRPVGAADVVNASAISYFYKCMRCMYLSLCRRHRANACRRSMRVQNFAPMQVQRANRSTRCRCTPDRPRSPPRKCAPIATRKKTARERAVSLRTMEPADKPGSVVSSHSSRPCVAARLEQPTRERRGPRHGSPIRSCSRWGLPCHAALAPRAVRSYRTFSPLPRASCDAVRRFAFCCTFRRLAPPRRYLAPCPVEPGLSSAQRVRRGCLASSDAMLPRLLRARGLCDAQHRRDALFDVVVGRRP